MLLYKAPTTIERIQENPSLSLETHQAFGLS